MALRAFEATIRLSNGNNQKVTVQAESPQNAKAMIEAQYGRGSIISGPAQKR